MFNRRRFMVLAPFLFVFGNVLFAATEVPAEHDAGRWIRPTTEDAPLLWGRTEGVLFGLPSEGGMPGPRGLVRIGIWNEATTKPELINFVAVEPVTQGPAPRHRRMAFSELEPSAYDTPQRGKRLWVAGTVLRTLPSNAEELAVRIEVEPFTANGAHVYLVARMRSDRPNEVAFSVYHHEDSSPIEENTLTATMGNYERLRRLWLKDRTVDSRVLYDGYDEMGFVEKENYPLNEMLRVGDGDALVLCSSDEPNPSAVTVNPPWWTYKSVRLTQYWRVPAEDVRPDLRVRVNGRRVYWAGTVEIPGGIAFENFEVRQRYMPGQTFIFGLSRKEPQEIIQILD
jgi:hypothetical protein